METNHTPGPWSVDECEDANGFSTLRPNGNTDAQPIATVYTDANAARIVACVNACEGLSDDFLFWKSHQQALKHLKQSQTERDELAAALSRMADRMGAMMRDYELPEECNGIIADSLDVANAALARVQP